MKPLAIVIPWYGESIRGGAENEAFYLAHIFKDNGICVEVFTTCVRDAACPRGENTYMSGAHVENDILVRRFKVKSQNLERYIEANGKIYNGYPFTIDDETAYFEEDINSPDMYRYIANKKDEYEAFLFMPYLYGITYNGTKCCPDNCFLISCFHDEPYAHMKLVKEMAERMKGIIYLSTPEKVFANRLFNLKNVANEVLGAGVDDGWENELNPMKFRDKYEILDPFILYAGRKDSGKKADMLVDYFCKYKERNQKNNLKLVMIGGGDISIPKKYCKDIIDLGFIPVEDKHNAFSAATVFCNPSWFESFSIVIMESWLARRPVMVSSQCAVTKNFCIETNGGLYFSDYYEFEGCLNYLVDNEHIANQMGKNGFEYVQNNFIKNVIANKYIRFINDVLHSEK